MELRRRWVPGLDPGIQVWTIASGNTGKDDVEVGNRQQIGLPGNKPGVAKVSKPMTKILEGERSEDELDIISTELEVEDALPIELEMELAEIQPESDLLS